MSSSLVMSRQQRSLCFAVALSGKGLGRETHAEWVGDQASNYRWSRTMPEKNLKSSRVQEPTNLCSMFSNTAHTKTYPSAPRCRRGPVLHIASKTESLEIVALSRIHLRKYPPNNHDFTYCARPCQCRDPQANLFQ